ncbi:kinesin-like protein KIN-13A [Impatiens glandulifera]|uniref:kinesin-like protein KIN-13A n=1 Tax=Impatiens glandulifera TaxID=253017 RepID=UPI001FB1255E|nr:kinesin-like protein KIN-13A [Impatiens glandulifera]
MISCISPNAGSCEHTLNTLRYADRVKSLSKGGNSKKDQGATSSLTPTYRESSSATTFPFSSDIDDFQEHYQEVKMVDMGRRVVEKDNQFQNPPVELNKLPSTYTANYLSNGREEVDKQTFGGITSQKPYSSTYTRSSAEADEKVQKVSPPRRKASVDEKPERLVSLQQKKDAASVPDVSTSSYKQQQQKTINFINDNGVSKQYEPESPDGNINQILEEEEALIAAHRKEIEDTMEIVREEMKLLAEVDQPGSMIDNYITQLSFVLSRKAAGLVSLQARLARFQHRLKEQEILSTRKRVPPR